MVWSDLFKFFDIPAESMINFFPAIFSSNCSWIFLNPEKSDYVQCVKNGTRSFLVHIFPHWDWIQSGMEHLSAFSLNAEKWGSEKLRIRALIKQWSVLHFVLSKTAVNGNCLSKTRKFRRHNEIFMLGFF